MDCLIKIRQLPAFLPCMPSLICDCTQTAPEIMGVTCTWFKKRSVMWVGGYTFFIPRPNEVLKEPGVHIVQFVFVHVQINSNKNDTCDK